MRAGPYTRSFPAAETRSGPPFRYEHEVRAGLTPQMFMMTRRNDAQLAIELSVPARQGIDTFRTQVANRWPGVGETADVAPLHHRGEKHWLVVFEDRPGPKPWFSDAFPDTRSRAMTDAEDRATPRREYSLAFAVIDDWGHPLVDGIRHPDGRLESPFPK